MKAEEKIRPEDIPNELLKWSADRPKWQQDALRRLVVKGALSQADLAELLAICKAGRGIIDPKSPPPEPERLAKEHFPQAAAAGESVTLKQVFNIANTNALAPNQRLRFAQRGLTIVYGDNGAGKSGYARILKRACRARSRGDKILSNVFESPATGPAVATIHYRIGNSDCPLAWRDEATSPVLPAISYFDSDCASIYVANANDIAFTPFGLDLFEKLAAACRALKTVLDQAQQWLQQQQPVSLRQPPTGSGTKVTQALKCLSAKSEIAEIEQLAKLTEQEEQRYEQLRAIEAQDPAKLVSAVRVSRTRVSQLVESTSSFCKALSAGVVESLRQAREESVTAAEAARIAADSLFQGEPLAGVGSQVWRQLWEAARRYSEGEAYEGQAFPVTEPDARCVLCQQPLGPEISTRLKRFEAFVRDDTQRQAERARAAYDAAVASITAARVKYSAVCPLLKELESHDKAASFELRKFIAAAWARRRSILKACLTGNFEGLYDLPTFPKGVENVIATLSVRMQELEDASKDEERKRLMAELQELKDRSWLSSLINDVKVEIGRLKALANCAQCIRDTDTTAISTKGGSLADAVVTSALRDRFASEIQRLHLKSVSVELNPAGSKQGAKLYQIRLVGAPKAGIERVVSEGEHRCLALAAFLAELATTADTSTLILDDPVSSLDHVHRNDVAKRLVEEGKKRQVIIFTHDIVFLHELARQSSEKGLGEPFYQYVQRNDTHAGYCGDDIPLRAKPVLEKIGHLKKQAKQIEALYESGQTEKYEELAGLLYKNTRTTWEAAVAEALQPVIERFKRGVNTKNLLKVTVITDDDCRLINEQRSRCSEFQHDGGEASNQPAPPPDELLKDIEALSSWFEDLKKRQDAIKLSADTGDRELELEVEVSQQNPISSPQVRAAAV